MAVGTGHGATIAFTTSNTFAPSVISIDGGDVTRPRLDTSHLGTSGARTMIPGDLREVGTWTVTCLANPTTAVLLAPPIGSAAETITITLGKTVPASSAGAIYAGTGFVVSRSYPSVQSDNLMTFTYEISWASEPSFTVEA
jgi:hypothetical protein